MDHRNHNRIPVIFISTFMYKKLLTLLLLTGPVASVFAQSTPALEATMCIGDTVTMTASVSYADSLQWYLDDYAIWGANRDTLVVFTGGSYYIRAYLRGGEKTCFDQSGDISVYMDASNTNDDHVFVPLGKAAILDVLGNDNPNCAALDRSTLHIVQPPHTGAIVKVEKGMITYQPSSTNLDPDRFTYTIADVKGRRLNESTVVVEVFVDCAVLYPNPVNDVLHVAVNSRRIYAIRMYDGMGREVYKTVVDKANFDIDMRAYAQGFYLVELLEHNGTGCVIKIQKR